LILSGTSGDVDDNDVSADRLEIGHEFRAPDDVDGLQSARFRECDYQPPNPRIGGVLHHSLARLQVDILAEQKRRGQGIYRQHRQLLGSPSAGRAERPPTDMTIRSLQVKLEGGARTWSPSVTLSTPGQHLADPFIADDGWKRGEFVDALCDHEVVRVDGGILDADEDLV
jgi:hypothetical protein